MLRINLIWQPTCRAHFHLPDTLQLCFSGMRNSGSTIRLRTLLWKLCSFAFMWHMQNQFLSSTTSRYYLTSCSSTNKFKISECFQEFWLGNKLPAFWYLYLNIKGYACRSTPTWPILTEVKFSGDETEVECVPPVLLKVASELLQQSTGCMALHIALRKGPYTEPSLLLLPNTAAWLWSGRWSRSAGHCVKGSTGKSPKKPTPRLYRNFESAFQVLSSSSTINLSIRAEICMVDSFLCCFPSLHNVMGLHPSQHRKGVARCT